MNLSKLYKNRLVELAGIKSNDDSYSAFIGRLPYQQMKQNFINSIKSFKDIDDDKILEIFEFLGTQGYSDEDDAFDDFKEKIEFYKSMSDPFKLFRIIGVKNKKMIKTDNLGEHWTPHEWSLDGDMLMSIGYENWDDDVKPFVIEVMAPISEIDVLQTIVQNLNFPNEHEINLKNKGKGVKFIKSYKLRGF